MIQLFNIPSYKIDTGQFSNILHDKCVREFEQNFAQYVGAQYAVSLNSATSALFLIFKYLSIGSKQITIPSIIPPVVCNAIVIAKCSIHFIDDIDWIGYEYEIGATLRNNRRLFDSAQQVNKDQCKGRVNHLTVFSFYPTKPVGSCDGGMVVSDDKDEIEYLRELSLNGMSFAENNWDRKVNVPGWKMYANSIQSYIANENLKVLDIKKEKLATIRFKYNSEFKLKNDSDHLYRINVNDNREFVDKAKQSNIVCGIHYKAQHGSDVYCSRHNYLHYSNAESRTTVSIPFHEALTQKEIETVIKFVNENKFNNPGT